MSAIYIECKPLAHLIQWIAGKVNGGIIPGAVTVMSTTVYLEKPDDAVMRHELVHQKQWLRFRPWWMPFNPWRDRIAYTRFLAAYVAEHRANGYAGNKFELEARAAE